MILNKGVASKNKEGKKEERKLGRKELLPVKSKVIQRWD